MIDENDKNCFKATNIDEEIDEAAFDTDEEIDEAAYDKKEKKLNKRKKEIIFREQLAIVDRSEKYSDIINNYKEYIYNTNSFKLNKQESMFKIYNGLLIVSVIGLVLAIIIILLYSGINNIASAISLISVVTAFISTIIIIPSRIAEFVYNKEETQAITEIIKNIQIYDMNTRSDIFKDNKE